MQRAKDRGRRRTYATRAVLSPRRISNEWHGWFALRRKYRSVRLTHFEYRLVAMAVRCRAEDAQTHRTATRVCRGEMQAQNEARDLDRKVRTYFRGLLIMVLIQLTFNFQLVSLPRHCVRFTHIPPSYSTSAARASYTTRCRHSSPANNFSAAQHIAIDGDVPNGDVAGASGERRRGDTRARAECLGLKSQCEPTAASLLCA